jgi:catechol 2,3-dioxygenase-like lactoylglutathione lyase family enzyme
MLFLSIDHPAIACQDVNRQMKWYCEQLGMQLIASDGKMPPGLLVGYGNNANGGAMVELMPAREPGPAPDAFARFQPGLRHLAFRVANFDEAYNRLKAGGVKFLFEPVNNAVGGGKIVSFRDPEGNELQIVERK